MSQFNLQGEFFKLNNDTFECILDTRGDRFATLRNILTYDTIRIRKEYIIEEYEYIDRSSLGYSMMRG